MDFAHLHVHSEYSLIDSTLRINQLASRAREFKVPAVALTDYCNLFAAVKFYRAAIKQGVKPVIGAEIPITDRPELGLAGSIVMLCRDREGYRNLCGIVSMAYTKGQLQDGSPAVNLDWLTNETMAGLIVLSGGLSGDVGQMLARDEYDQASRRVRHYQSLLGDDYFLEVSRTGRRNEAQVMEQAISLATELSVPLCATNDVRFLDRDDYRAHEARICIYQGRTLADKSRLKQYSNEQYFKSRDEMVSGFADLPDALANAGNIAKLCNQRFDLDTYHLPEFPLSDDCSVEDRLEQETRVGLTSRLESIADQTQAGEYWDRLDRELSIINEMGFAGYFLIVADFVKWAKDNGIPVGPGRGSGAGSVAAYALAITELDPVSYDLLFERFLNPERVSMPDFDIDFCMERRDEVIDYVSRRYGQEQVAQIITHGKMAAKAVVRDVGRVLGHPYGFVDQIAKLIPFEINITLERALAEEAQLKARYENEEEVSALIDLAMQLEGIARNAGRHAGGVVISPKPLVEYMPKFCEPGGDSPVTQFDMEDVEGTGLVKFDFLGLKTLTIIDWAVKNINRTDAGADLDISSIALDDTTTFALIQKAQTTAVFQLESRGMKELITRLEPDCFDDLIALVALFRPGPLQSGMVDDFIERKHGRNKVTYLHPALEPILSSTYGVILYQEQVMQIAQSLAGYSLGAADLLRRAMGKKKPEEMAKQREIFMSGAKERDVDVDTARTIFDLMEKFAGYGFNKSHSAAYALVAYQTAWLKANHPAAFMAAVMSADLDATEKLVGLRRECLDLGVNVLAPHVNRSSFRFTLNDSNDVVYGLGAIKGVGQGAVETICDARAEQGKFNSLTDLCLKVDTKKLNRRALEALVKAGAFDGLASSRAAQIKEIEFAVSAAEQSSRSQQCGQEDLFGVVEDVTQFGPEDATPEWPESELLRAEKESLGWYLSGHPFHETETIVEHYVTSNLANVQTGHVRLCGLVIDIRKQNTRRGRMAIVTLEDHTAQVEVVVYSELLEQISPLLRTDTVMAFEGQCSDDERGRNIVSEKSHSVVRAYW